MNYNVNDIEKHLKELQNKLRGPLSNGGTIFWKPSKEDKKVIRILPRIDQLSPFFETWTHFRFAGKNLYCPKFSEGLDCAICNFANKLSSSHESRDLKLVENIKAKLAFHAIITEVSDPPMDIGQISPKFWTFHSLRVYRKFLEHLRDPDYSKFTNLDNKGWDFKLYYVPRTDSQTMPDSFKYTIEFNPFKQRALIKKEQEKDFSELLISYEEKFSKIIQRIKTPQEIKEIFDEWAQDATNEKQFKSKKNEEEDEEVENIDNNISSVVDDLEAAINDR